MEEYKSGSEKRQAFIGNLHILEEKLRYYLMLTRHANWCIRDKNLAVKSSVMTDTIVDIISFHHSSIRILTTRVNCFLKLKRNF